MDRGYIKLDNPARFAGKYEIPAEKIQKAIKAATMIVPCILCPQECAA